ncbi:hypothetical protein Tco_0511943 [Tanacetum coccineum]
MFSSQKISTSVPSSDTRKRPPMLDKEQNFESWQQRIPSGTLCLGKDNEKYNEQHEVHANGEQHMMERFLQPTNEPLALGRASVQEQSYGSRRQSCGSRCCRRNKRIIKEYHFRETAVEENVVAGNVGSQKQRSMINLDSDYFKDKMLLMQAQENGVVLDEEQSLFLKGEHVTNFDDDVDDSPRNDLALNVDHIFEADQCDAFDSTLRGPPNVQTMFKYLEDNEENGVQSNVSFVKNDALMSIINEMHEEGVQQGVQSRLANKPDKVVNDSLTSELVRYKELVGVYEQRANENDRKKAETSVPKPLSALTVYPPNTPVKLVPRILPTKSQVKINLYGISHNFLRNLTNLTKRESPQQVVQKGKVVLSKQKELPFTEVIPIFQTLRTLWQDFKLPSLKKFNVMEEIFDQMNDEVDKNTVASNGS